MKEKTEKKPKKNMSLTARMMIAFLAVIIIPIIMIAVILELPMSSRLRAMGQTYGVENLSYSGMYNNSGIIAGIAYDVLDRLEVLIREDPSILEDGARLSEFNRSLEEEQTTILITKDGVILYNGTGSTDEEISRFLESPGSTGTDRDSGWIMINSKTQTLFAGSDVALEGGDAVRIFASANMNQVWPGIRRWLIDLIAVCIFALVMAALVMGVWLYSSTVNPLNQLKKAAQNIRDGNLDFKVETRGVTEISEVCEDFEEMRIRLKESAEEKLAIDNGNKELISNISHDLKTPITAIRGYCEGIMDGVADTPEKIEKYVRTIYNKANEMDTLINELTFYSRIDTNRIPYTFAKVRISDFFDDCAEELSDEADSRGINFSYSNELADKNTVVIADTEQLKRVVHNIVSNSIKYMDKPEKEIRIRLMDQDDFVHAEIEDNGRGIAKQDLEQIFDRFYRTDASRNSARGGSGIGLSIVKKIMEDHGGKVWASSEEGKGTTMHLILRKWETA